MLRSAVAVALVASCSGFQAPATFSGANVKSQASCRSSGVTMSMEESTSRRAALGAILAGALAPASAMAAYSPAKNKGDANWQLKENGVMTGVESSSMSGVRASASGSAVFGNKEKALRFERKEVDDAAIDKVNALTQRITSNSVLDKYKTSNKIGINPAFGGSSGIFTGAK